jgi:hypothetical protein
MEDNLNFLEKERQPKFVGNIEDDLKMEVIYKIAKWKTTLIFGKMEDNLNILEYGRQPQLYGRRPQF